MTTESFRKAIRSDVAMVSGVIAFVAGILWPIYSIKTDIALLSQGFSTLNTTLVDIKTKDNDQDIEINQNAISTTENTVNISNIRDTLNQRGFSIRQVDVRQSDTTDYINNRL